LHLKCSQLTAKRDRVFAAVETGDDTGHRLVMVLNELRRVEERIERISERLSFLQERSKC
ncbi:MAG: hypothetical protein KDB27_24430, partial [Planctomycetales bacterium]|nr:hypothetical protein [Planctomycetales bacterium]